MQLSHIARLLLVALSITSVVSFGEEPAVPLASVPLDIYALKKWGDLRYDLYVAATDRRRVDDVAITEREMRYIATQKITTQVKNDEVVMSYYWIEPSLHRGGAVVTLHCRKDNLLSLARMELQRDAKTFQVDVTDGNYELEFLSKSRGGEFPADTVTDASLMRIVTLLPKTAGATYTLGHRTQTPEINILPGDKLSVRCIGPETMETRGRVTQCTKYTCGDMLFWVRNSDNLLLRYEIPGWKIMELNEDGTLPARK